MVLVWLWSHFYTFLPCNKQFAAQFSYRCNSLSFQHYVKCDTYKSNCWKWTVEKSGLQALRKGFSGSQRCLQFNRISWWPCRLSLSQCLLYNCVCWPAAAGGAWLVCGRAGRAAPAPRWPPPCSAAPRRCRRRPRRGRAGRRCSSLQQNISWLHRHGSELGGSGECDPVIWRKNVRHFRIFFWPRLVITRTFSISRNLLSFIDGISPLIDDIADKLQTEQRQRVLYSQRTT